MAVRPPQDFLFSRQTLEQNGTRNVRALKPLHKKRPLRGINTGADTRSHVSPNAPHTCFDVLFQSHCKEGGAFTSPESPNEKRRRKSASKKQKGEEQKAHFSTRIQRRNINDPFALQSQQVAVAAWRKRFLSIPWRPLKRVRQRKGLSGERR